MNNDFILENQYQKSIKIDTSFNHDSFLYCIVVERWQSGWMQLPWKQPSGQPDRGFKSHSLRHLYFDLCMTPHKHVFWMKFTFTLVFIVFFVFVIAYADKFAETKQELAVSPTFVGLNDSNSAEINLDEIASVELDANDKWVIKVKVQPGDTLDKIARTFGSTISHIKEINHITGPIRPGDTLMITDEEKGFVYSIPKKTNVMVFANQYNLNLEDLMTLNYMMWDATEVLQAEQEIFIPITMEDAYNKWLLERPAPVIITKTSTNKRPTITKPQWTSVARSSTPTSSSGGGTKSKIISKRVYKSNVSNGFYAGQCTHYVAMITPALFPYTSKTTQSRKITGNASNRCKSAKANGYSVWSKPSVWAVVVYKAGGGVSYAGHVAKVVSLNSEDAEMTLEEANYIAKWVADRRVESTKRSNIACYIYPGR